MDPVTVIAVFAAVAKALPDMVNVIKSIAEGFARDHNLNAAELVRAIGGDQHERVDAIVDAEIAAHTWPKP